MKATVRAWLTGQFGEDDELFAEIYGQYATDMKERAQKLPALLAAWDVAALGENGHAMKGMALQVGDEELAEQCKRLQTSGRASDLPSCVVLVPEIVRLVAEL